VENTNDAIYIHDFEGDIIEVNENACRMVGFAREELIGANLVKIDKEWYHPVHEDLERLLRDGHAVFKRENVRKDGSVVPIEVSVKIISREGKGIVQAFVRDITERKKADKEREHLISELQKALSNVKKMSGLLPICASCKKIRDDRGYWNQVEKYVSDHSEAQFSHGICPECTKMLYPDIYENIFKSK
jgi:PAS domain S-box-containing protein